MSIFDGTFLANSHLPANHFLRFAYLWLMRVPEKSIQEMTRHSWTTVCNYYMYFDQLVSSMVEDHDQKIGGPGVVVEIDESKFGKRKYNRGHHVDGVWVVGGVEQTPEGRMFALSVTRRDKDILKTVISDHINPGTVIYTDSWKAYSGAIDELNRESDMKLSHHMVNHKETFKNEEGICTNTIEGTWSGIKCNLKSRAMNSESIDGKLLVFIWRRENEGHLWDALMKALAEVRYE